MMSRNSVIEGDYKGKMVLNPTGKPYITIGFGKKLYLNKETVEEYQLIDEDTRKSAASGVARGLVGGALLGPVGMLAGGLSAKNKSAVMVTIQFKDGKKSLLEIDGIIYKSLVQKMF